MYGQNIFLQCFRKNKDFDPISFDYSMLLNSKIEKEHFFRYTQEISILPRTEKNPLIYKN